MLHPAKVSPFGLAVMVLQASKQMASVHFQALVVRLPLKKVRLNQGRCLVTSPLIVNETLQQLSTLPVFMQ